MSSNHLKTKGRPIAIRQETFNKKVLFCLDFEINVPTILTKGLPKQNMFVCTYILHEKQWYDFLKQLYSSGLSNIEQLNSLYIIGNIVPSFTNSISPHEMTALAEKIDYIPFSKHTNNRDPITCTIDESYKYWAHPKNDTFKTLKAMHDEHHGKCQRCGQSCDIQSMQVVNRSAGKMLYCTLCANHKTITSFEASSQLNKRVAAFLGWDLKRTTNFLITFPRNYALVRNTYDYLTYWSWDAKNPILLLQCTYDGEIVKVIPRDYIAFAKSGKFIQAIDKNSYNSFETNIYYRKLNKQNIILEHINISDQFLHHPPRKEKIQRKIDSYLALGNFKENPIVIQEESGFCIVDGYATLVAALSMNIKELDIWIVEKEMSKERITHDFIF